MKKPVELEPLHAASTCMQRAVYEARALPLQQKAVLAALYAEMLGVLPPKYLKTMLKGAEVETIFAVDGSPRLITDDDKAQ